MVWMSSTRAVACSVSSLTALFAAIMQYGKNEGFYTPGTTTTSTWAINAYMCADNNLEAYGLADAGEMKSASLAENITVTYQLDRAEGYSTADGDWTNTQRVVLTEAAGASQSSAVTTSLAETDMEAGIIPWGDGKAALDLIKEIRKGTPLGRIVGCGAGEVGRVYGQTRVPVVKNQAIPAYDPRAVKGVGLTYATTPMSEKTSTSGLSDSPSRDNGLAESRNGSRSPEAVTPGHSPDQATPPSMASMRLWCCRSSWVARKVFRTLLPRSPSAAKPVMRRQAALVSRAIRP